MSNAKTGLYTNHSYARFHTTAFAVTHAKSGVFIRALRTSGRLCRVYEGSVYFYDRYAKKEIEISLDMLQKLA